MRQVPSLLPAWAAHPELEARRHRYLGHGLSIHTRWWVLCTSREKEGGRKVMTDQTLPAQHPRSHLELRWLSAYRTWDQVDAARHDTQDPRQGGGHSDHGDQGVC